MTQKFNSSRVQHDTTISQYFHKVKLLYQEIGDLDPQAPISDTSVKRIIIRGLRPEFRGFVIAIQGWKIQLSLVEFDNSFVGQEALVKNTEGSSWNSNEQGGLKRNEDNVKSFWDKRSSHVGGVAKPYVSNRKFRKSRYNCSKKRHKAHSCWLKKKPMKGNVATVNSEQKWDVEALFVAKKKMVLTTVMSNQIDHKNH
ncbi:hypothetical protein PVK06_047057 [Gossypium arboreum]|uniref:Uncharacterized protein n=1 Tax=Gossypium arboreum TaxID=29729 RepID=A0ABR0MEB5_GOSAR|nr:hypothetical protein PVK06_047057 [Gossypium arboreum]